MDIKITRNGNEAIAVIDKHYNLGLGMVATKTDSELIEIAKIKYEENKNKVYAPSYKELRAREYPLIQEQLDIIYWDKINNTNKWQDLITTIKKKYPKS